MVKKALISGFAGHGGSYLSGVLLGKSYKVYGLIRRSSSFNTGRIDHSINDKKYNNKFFFYHGDLTDASSLNKDLEKTGPNDDFDIDISHINVSSGEEISIRELAFLIKNIVGFKGIVTFDHSMPYGTPRKVLDATFLNQVNMTSKNGLKNCLRSLYSWYKENQFN